MMGSSQRPCPRRTKSAAMAMRPATSAISFADGRWPLAVCPCPRPTANSQRRTIVTRYSHPMSDPARFFAAASLVFGALLIALTPPFQTPDEPAHLFRAWSISEGTLFARGGASVPRSLVDAAAAGLARPAFARTPLRPGDRVFVATVADSWRHPLAYTAPSYTPLGYAVAAPATLLGRALSLSPVALVYLGR